MSRGGRAGGGAVGGRGYTAREYVSGKGRLLDSGALPEDPLDDLNALVTPIIGIVVIALSVAVVVLLALVDAAPADLRLERRFAG